MRALRAPRIPTLVLLTCLVSAVSAAEKEPASLDALAWLAGDWQARTGEVLREERWSVPWGGVMLGVHRDQRDDGRLEWEMLRIEQEGGSLVYLASPRGRCPPTPFRLIELSDRRVAFANPEHDFPKRIVYWIADDGALHARAEGDDGEGPEWRWERQD